MRTCKPIKLKEHGNYRASGLGISTLGVSSGASESMLALVVGSSPRFIPNPETESDQNCYSGDPEELQSPQKSPTGENDSPMATRNDHTRRSPVMTAWS
jgi:hypothetical protein